jgi:hypothetical protein
MVAWNSWKELRAKHKFVVLVLALFGVTDIATVIVLILYTANEQYRQPSAAIKNYLDGMLQTINEEKPFSYTIISYNRGNSNISLVGDKWCFVITPSIQETNSSDKVNHFIVVFSNPQ